MFDTLIQDCFNLLLAENLICTNPEFTEEDKISRSLSTVGRDTKLLGTTSPVTNRLSSVATRAPQLKKTAGILLWGYGWKYYIMVSWPNRKERGRVIWWSGSVHYLLCHSAVPSTIGWEWDKNYVCNWLVIHSCPEKYRSKVESKRASEIPKKKLIFNFDGEKVKSGFLHILIWVIQQHFLFHLNLFNQWKSNHDNLVKIIR